MRFATRLVWRTTVSLIADHATSYAAAIAYYALFSVFPITLFFVSISGYFMTNAERNQLITQISNQLSEQSAAEIYRLVQTATRGRAGLGIIGFLGTLWAGSSVFTAIRTGLYVIWHKRSRRSYVTMKILDLIGVVAVGVMLTAALAATIYVTRLEAIAHHVLGAHLSKIATLAFGLGFSLTPVALVFLTFWLLFAIASPPHINKRSAAMGALTTAVGFELVSLGFSLYVSYFGHYDKVYGSLGAVIAFLVYAYLVGLLILIGGEVAEQHFQLQNPAVIGAASERERPGATALATRPTVPVRRLNRQE